MVHHHIPKTGGTSINHAFYGLAYEPNEFDQFLSRNTDHPVFGGDDFLSSTQGRQSFMRANRNGGVAVGNRYVITRSTELASRGRFSYFHGHFHHRFKTPSRADEYHFTVLRDPLQRIVSRYKHDISLSLDAGLEHYDRDHLSPLLSDPIEYFKHLKDNEPKHFLAQIATFSANLDPYEALDRIGYLDLIVFQDQMSDGLDRLTLDIGKTLSFGHAKKSPPMQVEVKEKLDTVLSRHRQKIEEWLQPEIDFFNKARESNVA